MPWILLDSFLGNVPLLLFAYSLTPEQPKVASSIVARPLAHSIVFNRPGLLPTD